jgi:hypothetical protein
MVAPLPRACGATFTAIRDLGDLQWPPIAGLAVFSGRAPARGPVRIARAPARKPICGPEKADGPEPLRRDHLNDQFITA